METFYVCNLFTLLSSVLVKQSKGLPNFCVCVMVTQALQYPTSDAHHHTITNNQKYLSLRLVENHVTSINGGG